MTLPTYKDFDEKSENFKICKVETIDHYHELVNRQAKLKGVYRGISSSNYKIYTSLQRRIILSDLKESFQLSEYINNFRKNELFKNYFKTLRVEPSKLSVYSLLQHYGAPTPFLDFTYNFEKALYFAIEKFDILKYEEKGTIDDYFSVFFIEQSDLKLIEIEEVIRGLKALKESSAKLMTNYPDAKYEDLIGIVDRIFGIKTCNVFLISHREEFLDIYNAYNNIRIVAQEGLFIHNDYDDRPLEKALKDFFLEATIRIGSELDDSTDPKIIAENEEYYKRLEKNRIFQKRLEKNIIHSFEIKKELIPEIKKNFKLTNDDMYPDTDKLCQKIFEDSLPK
jgi:hypothetical protein